MRILFVSRGFTREAAQIAAWDPDELVMVVDVDRCIACGACELACRIEHGEDATLPAPYRPIPIGGEPGGGRGGWIFMPLTCRRCDSPCEYHGPYNFWITCPSTRESSPPGPFCDACLQRVERGWWPACATRCAMKTIYFGRPRDMALVLAEKRLRELGDVEFDA